MAALAVAVRFIPYTDDRGHLHLGWSPCSPRCFVAVAASVYLVLVLEILKLRRLRAWQLRRADPERRSTRSTARSSASWRQASSASSRDLGGSEPGGIEPDGVANRTCDAAAGWYRPATATDAPRRGGEQTG